MFDTILFDLDGTLTDSAEGIINSVKYAFAKMGIQQPDNNTLQKFIGPPLSASFKEYFGHTYYKDLEKLAEKYTVLAYHCDYREKPGDCKLRFAAVPVQS